MRGTLRAGAISAAALEARATPAQLPVPEHSREQDYVRFVETLSVSPQYRRQKVGCRRRFAQRWPDLVDWFGEPLKCRIGRLPGENRQRLRARL